MHIPPFDNNNHPIIDIDSEITPLTYFNIIHLKQGERFEYSLADYESCVVPATGQIDITIDNQHFKQIGKRTKQVWDGEPEGVYVPTHCAATLHCTSPQAEVFIAGARFNERLEPFAILSDDIDIVQYGSDETKTHRKIKHILGAKQHGKVGRLLVSELYTVGQGGWSGFPPHKHQADRLPDETCHHEIYNFRFNPAKGFGMQLLQQEDDAIGSAYHLIDGSTVAFQSGYHPCVVAPGYEMYYFTILGGKSQRSLIQSFQPEHAEQVDTIPGIKDMIQKFK